MAMEGAFPFYVSDFHGSEGLEITPNQLRWKPQEMPGEGEKVKFLDGV